MSDFVDDFGGGLGRFAGFESVAVMSSGGCEAFVGETDEVTVFDMIMNRRVPISAISCGVVTVPFFGQEVLDVRDGHRIDVAHCIIGDNVARMKIIKGGSRGESWELQGKKSKGGNKSEEEGEFSESDFLCLY